MNIPTAIRAYTTFEVARICGVFHTTVINWVNKGKLKAHHTPGGHRRIPHTELIEFMRRYDMPIPENLLQTKKRVLVVEDDLSVQRMLVRALEGLGALEVQVVVGGVDALIAIGRHAPDLLLLDVGIPQVNGMDVCKVLRSNEHTKEIPIIAISGQPLSAEDVRFLRQQTDHFFRKPLSPVNLKTIAARLLEIDVPEAPKRRL